MKALLTGALFALSIQSAVQASTPHETFFLKGLPSREQVAIWSSLPGTRSYLFQAKDPAAPDLQPLAQLRGADRIQVETGRYPGNDTVEVWKDLASKGVELVGFGAGYPNDDEVRRINEAGFSKTVLVAQWYPRPEEANRIARLPSLASITFVTGGYPKFTDRGGLSLIPDRIPLLFVVDYWPWYNHMDLFNLLPHAERLRVMGGFFPSRDSLGYLRAMKHLAEVTVDSDFDPSPEQWQMLRGFAVTWSSRNHVPSEASLKAFAESGGGTDSRKLVIDQDAALTADELDRLSRSPLPVEWVHAAADWSPL